VRPGKFCESKVNPRSFSAGNLYGAQKRGETETQKALGSMPAKNNDRDSRAGGWERHYMKFKGKVTRWGCANFAKGEAGGTRLPISRPAPLRGEAPIEEGNSTWPFGDLCNIDPMKWFERGKSCTQKSKKNS